MIGVVARAEDRGLGHLTWEAVRALEPDRVLVVTMGARDAGFDTHLERFPGATIVEWQADGTLDPAVVRPWLDGLEVVYGAETPYDDRFAAWCKVAGVSFVLHAMPEFWRPQWGTYGERVWNPTSWRHSTLPPGSRIVGVPVALDRWPAPAPLRTEPVFVHVVGHRTAGDRNGSVVLNRALPYITHPIRLRIISQSARFPALRPSPNVELELVRGGPADYWRLYDDADVLVMPRRYGGLSLPVQEAMGAGLAVVMTDVEPNREWPIVPVVARPRSTIRTPGGTVQSYEPDPRRLGHFLSTLAERHELRHQHQREARAWAESASWANVRDRWIESLLPAR